MIKEYIIKLKIELPKERESEMLSDEENLKSIKDLLLEELSSDEYNLDVETFILKNYDAEIRKSLEDTVERLIQEIKDLECLVKLKEQAKQEVIAELEEWMDKDENCYIYNFEGWTKRKELKQKLNQMKEV